MHRQVCIDKTCGWQQDRAYQRESLENAPFQLAHAPAGHIKLEDRAHMKAH